MISLPSITNKLSIIKTVLAAIVLTPEEISFVKDIVNHIYDILCVKDYEENKLIFHSEIEIETVQSVKELIGIDVLFHKHKNNAYGVCSFFDKKVILYIEPTYKDISEQQLKERLILTLSHELIHAKDIEIRRLNLKYKRQENLGEFNEENFHNLRKLILGHAKEIGHRFIGMPIREAILALMNHNNPLWEQSKDRLSNNQKKIIYSDLEKIFKEIFSKPEYDQYILSRAEVSAKMMEALVYADARLPENYLGKDIQDVVEQFFKEFRLDTINPKTQESLKKQMYKYIVMNLTAMRNK